MTFRPISKGFFLCDTSESNCQVFIESDFPFVLMLFSITFAVLTIRLPDGNFTPANFETTLRFDFRVWSKARRKKNSDEILDRKWYRVTTT
jgi:hypothetical protein